jgi:hypothetical protein
MGIFQQLSPEAVQSLFGQRRFITNYEQASSFRGCRRFVQSLTTPFGGASFPQLADLPSRSVSHLCETFERTGARGDGWPMQFAISVPLAVLLFGATLLGQDHFSNVGQVDLQVACIAKRDHGHWRGVGAYLQPICAVLHSPKELTPNLIDIWQCGRRLGLTTRQHKFLSSFPFVGCDWI